MRDPREEKLREEKLRIFDLDRGRVLREATDVQGFALLAGLASSLKVPSEEVPARVSNLVERLKVAEKELERVRLSNARAAAVNAAAGAQTVGKVRLVAQRMSG